MAQAEEMLRKAADGNGPATEQIHRLLRLLETQRELSAAQPRPIPREKPRVWAYPGAPKLVESRPRPVSELGGSGRRRVPYIAGEPNGMGFLRIKKPQSPYLSRMLRDAQKLKNKHTDRKEEMENISQIGKWESYWDESIENTGANGEWSAEAVAETRRINLYDHAKGQKNRDFGRKLVEIHKKEKGLWTVERRARMDEKRRGLENIGKREFTTTTKGMSIEMANSLDARTTTKNGREEPSLDFAHEEQSIEPELGTSEAVGTSKSRRTRKVRSTVTPHIAFRCSVCESSFFTNSERQRHERRKHNLGTPSTYVGL
jgi:hypothetical protein